MGLRIIIVGDGQLGSELKNILNTRKSCIGEIPKEYEDADVKILKYPEFDITN